MLSPRVRVMGFEIDQLTQEGFFERIDSFVAGTGGHQIITANALMLLAAEQNQALAEAFRSADLVVPDSSGMMLAARLKRFQFPEKLAGVDLVEALCARSAEKGWRVFFLGAAPGVAEAAALALARRHPGLLLAGARNGYFKPQEESRVMAEVHAARPDLLFVALSVPRQDIWVHQNLAGLGAKVVMGVGGSFDVLSGRLKRAPEPMQKAGLEWLFRLWQEPSRISRMVHLPLFFWKVMKT